MSKDRLEQFIHENRAAFDDQEPGEKVWQGISRDLDADFPVRRLKRQLWYWKAAALLLLMTSGLLLWSLLAHPISLESGLAKASKDFTEIEAFYFKQISEKRELIYHHEDLLGDVDFEHELQKLDAMYQVLKTDLDQRPSKEVVDALILNLLVRIDILNKALERLEEKDVSEGEVNT